MTLNINNKFKKTLIHTFLGLLAGAICTPSFSQTWPNKPVRIIIPFAPGGATDAVARPLAARLQEQFGQAFIIENKVGANGNIGADFVAKSAPDGHTLLIADLGTFTSGPAVFTNTPFDPINDFTQITLLISSPYGLAIHPSLPITTVAELLSYAKNNPAKFNYAMLGGGSASHLAGIELGARAKVAFTFIPYKGGAPALTDVAGGQSQAISIAMLSTYPFVKSGKLRLIAIMGKERLSFLPEIPTVAEAGFPGFVAGQWQGFFGPKGLPKDILEKLRTETIRYLNSPEIKKRFADLGGEVTTTSSEELAKFIIDEKNKFDRLVKEHQIKVD
ncbi:MAG: tripartite tricarboxylate transporter substrate binding protein [Polynucleobacter sp.]|nr:tripartite tricarboxylate transporter substrate binding protein [Polynucleobacter sp.]